MKWFKHETDSIHSEKLTRLKNEFGFSLRVIYIDHGLRKEAAEEKQKVTAGLPNSRAPPQMDLFKTS